MSLARPAASFERMMSSSDASGDVIDEHLTTIPGVTTATQFGLAVIVLGHIRAMKRRELNGPRRRFDLGQGVRQVTRQRNLRGFHHFGFLQFSQDSMVKTKLFLTSEGQSDRKPMLRENNELLSAFVLRDLVYTGPAGQSSRARKSG